MASQKVSAPHSPKPQRYSQKSPAGPALLKTFREKKGMSQKALAEKMGIERTRLIRLEKKPWRELSVADLELLCRGFEMNVAALIRFFQGFDAQPELDRNSLKTPHSVIDSRQGYRLGSLLKQSGSHYAGVLYLSPHKTWPADACLQAEQFFYQILEGEILLTLASREYLLREKECFSIKGNDFYEFYNPHQFKEASVLLFGTGLLK